MPHRWCRDGASAVGGTRHLCVVLHDVAPARWDGCARVLKLLRETAARAGVELPVTLLVVPMMHGEGAASPHYLRWLRHLQDSGHELALHGLTHRDEGRPPRGLRERLLRRFYTAGEGEFAALERPEAEARLARARAWAEQQGLRTPGFVAPAWLMNEAGWDAVKRAGFTHSATLDRVLTLPGGEALQAQSLVFSTRSAWRRGLSLAWNRWLAQRLESRQAPLLRFELHPQDADHPAIARCWQRLLRAALRERTPLRLGEAAALARRGDGGTPPARRAA